MNKPVIKKVDKHRGHATVNCEGKKHHILVIGKKLVLHDHPGQSVTRMIALNKLGNSCRCAQVAEFWRKRDVEHLPEVLREKRPLPRTRVRSLFETKIYAGKLGEYQKISLVQDRDLVLKTAKLVSGIAKRVLSFSKARWLQKQNVVVVGVVHDPADAGISGLSSGDVENWPQGYAVGYKILVAADWIEHVYNQGLAELSDLKKRRYLTLRVLNYGTIPTPHVVRSAGGFAMHQTHASVIEKDGRRFLNILTEKRS